MFDNKVSKEEVCEILGISKPTFYKRLHNPEYWKAEEVEKLTELIYGTEMDPK
jgi:DNA invertase Pin-like site-specific DNA recombinase